MLYPAFFLSFVTRMTGLAEPSLTVAFFLCVIFGDDMNAYFVGSLWGRSTCLNLPVSPNKSAVGFAGGVTGAVIVALLFHWLAGGFPRRGLWLDLAIAVAIGIVGIVGDLVESGLKRSAGVKDSGVIIPGRGGILDSVDSLTARRAAVLLPAPSRSGGLMRRVIVLGSTGSIGTAALEVARALPDRLKVVGLGCRHDVERLAAQAAEFQPDAVAIADAGRLRGRPLPRHAGLTAAPTGCWR